MAGVAYVIAVGFYLFHDEFKARFIEKKSSV
jgi:hypothetical protein